MNAERENFFNLGWLHNYKLVAQDHGGVPRYHVKIFRILTVSIEFSDNRFDYGRPRCHVTSPHLGFKH